ncbi:hypothetical protein ACHAWF_001819 [Thalassiosira exigua]
MTASTPKATRYAAMLALILGVSLFFVLPTAAWTPPPPAHPAEASSVSSRGDFVRRSLVGAASAIGAASSIATSPAPSNAAPPFAVMAEEMGYFPVKDERTGETVMVPSRARRESTDQAVALAEHLRSTGTTMYGAFWCPHCSRQKELFGKEAWTYVSYVECDPRGYGSKFATCLEEGVDGYPSWKFGNGKSQGGEMELADIARMSGFKKPFDAKLETGVPPLGGSSCQ